MSALANGGLIRGLEMALVGVAFAGFLLLSLALHGWFYGKAPRWVFVVAVATGALMTLGLFASGLRQ